MPTQIVGTSTVAATFIKGNISGLKQVVEVWHQPGVDGYGSQTLGKANAPFEFVVIEFGSSQEIETFAAAIESLVGEIVSITDDWGVTHANLIIQEASPIQKTVDINNGGVRGEIQIKGVRIL